MTKIWKLWNCIEIDSERILNQKLFDDEVLHVEKNQDNGIEYYKDIYQNIELNSNNLINSHIMYAAKKVDKLNLNNGVLIKNQNYSLMDIDVDMPNSFREEAISYVEKTYGEDNVGHIITFGRFDGRGAIKEVFRILRNGVDSFELSNIITREMVDTAKIQDVLEDLKQDDPKYSVIQYCIDHLPKVQSFYDEYKREFDIAIHMSSTIFSQGKHAAGIVISNDPLNEIVPTCLDPKTGKRLVALEMADAEYCGVVKYDFLGVAALEKLGKISEMVNLGFRTPRMNSVHINYEEFENDIASTIVL